MRRINIIGGPGSGKSLTAHSLFSSLGKDGYNVEFVQEYIKGYVFKKQKIHKFEQVKFYAKQQEAEEIYLENGVDHIVTECPLWLSPAYAISYKKESLIGPLTELSLSFEKEYNSINVFLDRRNVSYVEKGRYQTLAHAKEIDATIYKFLKDYNIDFETFCPITEEEDIYDYVCTNLIP